MILPLTRVPEPRSSRQQAGFRLLLTTAILFRAFAFSGFSAEIRTSDETGELKRKAGNVRFQAARSEEVTAKIPQILNYGDRLRTLLYSKATVQFAGLGETTLDQLTELLIVRKTPTNAASAISSSMASLRLRLRIVRRLSKSVLSTRSEACLIYFSGYSS